MLDFCLNDLGDNAVFYNLRFIVLSIKKTSFIDEHAYSKVKVGSSVVLFAYDNHDIENNEDFAPFLLRTFDGIEFHYIYVTLIELRTMMGAGQFKKFYFRYKHTVCEDTRRLMEVETITPPRRLS